MIAVDHLESASANLFSRHRFRGTPFRFNGACDLSPAGIQLADSRYPEGMNWRDRIEVNPEVMTGKPVVRGTRLAVELILELLAAGESENQLLADYPRLTREDLLACLAYASHLAREFRAYPLSA